MRWDKIEDMYDELAVENIEAEHLKKFIENTIDTSLEFTETQANYILHCYCVHMIPKAARYNNYSNPFQSKRK